ncbi:hypothetical protein ACSSS7_007821 [Eimeria intestinalis]
MASHESVYAAAAACDKQAELQQHHDQQQHWGIGAAATSSGGGGQQVTGVSPSSVSASVEGSGGQQGAGTAEADRQAGGGGGGGIAEGLASGILPCRKRKAPEELPDIDEATAERLRRATESLTKEQLRMLLARACSHYPAVENALYALIEADPSSRRLMIRNVPYSTTETSLRQTLEAHGPIEDFKLVIDRNTGLNKGFAFVTYKSMEDVAVVLQSEVTVDGRLLTVKLASQQDQGAAIKQGERDRERERGGAEFEGFGIVKETAIVRNRDGTSKGYGFVVFEDPEALMKAASQAQRVIDGQVTFVSVASESRRQQQQQQQQQQMGGGVLPPQHLQQLPLGTNAHYQQQLQQQLLQQQAASQWPQIAATSATAATAARSDANSSPYGAQAALNTVAAAAAAAALPSNSAAAAAANPYVQQITAALMPQLYMHHYQQQYLASTQANAAAAATGLTPAQQQQQQQQKLSHLQHLQQ